MKKLEGKIAIVTGAARGIGFAVAQRFANEGATVAMCDIHSEKLEAAAKIIAATNQKTLHKVCDVTSNEEIDAFVSHVVEHAGGIDILVNNAAYSAPPTSLESEDEDSYLRCLDVGVNSAYRFMKRVFPHMKDKGGKIINFSSMAGIRGTKGAGGYAVAKAGVIGLTKVAANDWGEYGINVNCVVPMAMNDIWASITAKMPEGTSPTDAIGVRPTALGFVGEADKHIAPAVVFLASEDSDYITGMVMPADGGVTDLETK